jgi:holo-[acyl-carrier protein] synthase
VIVAIGLDVVEVERVAAAMRNPRFLPRILTPAERQVIKTPMRVAGRWAAKEAVAKAVARRLGWQDVEILPDMQGAPVVVVRSDAFDTSAMRLHVSISHEKGIAAAVAVLESIVTPSPLKGEG